MHPDTVHRLVMSFTTIAIIGFVISLLFLGGSALTGRVVDQDLGTVYGSIFLLVFFLFITLIAFSYYRYMKNKKEF